ncbi:helix-turn-helix transcriptional regulator [cf. Phormidesmis sp. LEGE 11477]|uniref:helix-turn-helix transcriptional regulator n=1 Tax=cf. Phormidesmis sp. LEGE 11477 TaxID=1828680 RepID=UPI001A101678|nr:AraC family transcriptional regulator [cf. Phormidesmis sp. LEGE 11477]MBE9059508.1 helix-turn-helix transcriptional regulator [cf. Phormidesmis sp. LEGE 11477]
MSLEVHRGIYLPPPDRMKYPASAEHCLTLHIANSDLAELSLNDGKRRSSKTYPGLFTFIPAQCSSEWWWEEKVELLEIDLSPALLEKTAIASSDKVPQQIELIDRFAIRDPFLEQLTFALSAESSGAESGSAELESNAAGNRLYLESLQTVLVTHLLRNHCSVPITTSSVSGKLSKGKLKLVVDYIQDHLNFNISLTELSEMVQLSPDHFRKLFKQSTGLSPHKYLLQCRIEKAKQLLSNEQWTIAEIGQMVGFFDQSHFTNTFRRHTNYTPRQYRLRI